MALRRETVDLKMNYSVLADQRKFLLKGAEYVCDKWTMLTEENVKNKHKELLFEEHTCCINVNLASST